VIYHQHVLLRHAHCPVLHRQLVQIKAGRPLTSAADAGELGSNGILPDVDSLRIPVQYLALTPMKSGCNRFLTKNRAGE
jgi:hypothetical protein